MATSRSRKKQDGIVGRVVWAILIAGIAFGLFKWLGDGISVTEPGWFDRARHNVEEGVNDGGQVIQQQVEQHVPYTLTPAPTPASEGDPKAPEQTP